MEKSTSVIFPTLVVIKDPPYFDQWEAEVKMEFDPFFEVKPFRRVKHSPPIRPSAPYKGVSFDETVVRHSYNPTPTLQTKKQQRLIDQAQTIIKPIQHEQSKSTGTGMAGAGRGDWRGIGFHTNTDSNNNSESTQEARFHCHSSSARDSPSDRGRGGLRHVVPSHHQSHGGQRSHAQQSPQHVVPSGGPSVWKLPEGFHPQDLRKRTYRWETRWNIPTRWWIWWDGWRTPRHPHRQPWTLYATTGVDTHHHHHYGVHTSGQSVLQHWDCTQTSRTRWAPIWHPARSTDGYSKRDAHPRDPSAKARVGRKEDVASTHGAFDMDASPWTLRLPTSASTCRTLGLRPAMDRDQPKPGESPFEGSAQRASKAARANHPALQRNRSSATALFHGVSTSSCLFA